MGNSTDPDQEVTYVAFDPVRPPPRLADKANDLDALRTTVVDAAGVSGALWLSYLFVVFYFLVAAGGVTHKDLFFESPVKLPFLNVDLPLKGFFWLGPVIFLIVHAYVLLHFVVLAGKIRVFDRALVEQVTDPDTRAGLRRQLPSNIFVQFLAGPRELRLGIVGALLWLIAVISLVAGPLALLLFFELQFLPYHEEWITWLQRLAVAADLALIWKLWPLIANPVANRWVLASIGGVIVVLVPFVTTFPGETLDGLFRDRDGSVNTPVLGWMRRRLVEGDVDPAARRPVSLWSNRLVLPGLDVIDHTKLDTDAKVDAIPVTISLRRRHLEAAVLIGAVLRGADFTGADLRWARLDSADLRKANFQCGYWDLNGRSAKRPPICTHLENASLDGSSLQGAWLSGTSLDGASLNRANLQFARLADASLQGASLILASLTEASLARASLRGAALDLASLEGASLIETSLQGASLAGASLQGASLDGASLQGASLNVASLQGTSLARTTLVGTFITTSFVWRSDNRAPARTEKLLVNGNRPDKVGPCADGSRNDCPWTQAAYQAWRARLAAVIPDDVVREQELRRIDALLDPDRTNADDEIASHWAEWERQFHDRPAAEAAMARQWQIIGCDANGAPYVAASLIARMLLDSGGIRSTPFQKGSPEPARLAAEFLKDSCAGTRDLTAGERASLHELAEARPTTP